LRSASRFTQLDQMARRIADLEKALAVEKDKDEGK
jgi:hypothetical protein